MTEERESFPRLLLLIGHAHVVKAHFARHGLLEDLFQGRRRLIRTIAGRGAADDLCGPVLVVAHGELGTGTRLELCQRRKRHHRALAVAHIELRQVLRIRPVGRFGLHVHLPGAAEIVEVVDEEPAHERLNGPVNVADRHTLLQHFLPVDLHELLAARSAETWYAIMPISGRLRAAARNLSRLSARNWTSFPARSSKHELKSARSADAGDRRRRETEDGPCGSRASCWFKRALMVPDTAPRAVCGHSTAST